MEEDLSTNRTNRRELRTKPVPLPLRMPLPKSGHVQGHAQGCRRGPTKMISFATFA